MGGFKGETGISYTLVRPGYPLPGDEEVVVSSIDDNGRITRLASDKIDPDSLVGRFVREIRLDIGERKVEEAYQVVQKFVRSKKG